MKQRVSSFRGPPFRNSEATAGAAGAFNIRNIIQKSTYSPYSFQNNEIPDRLRLLAEKSGMTLWVGVS